MFSKIVEWFNAKKCQGWTRSTVDEAAVVASLKSAHELLAITFGLDKFRVLIDLCLLFILPVLFHWQRWEMQLTI